MRNIQATFQHHLLDLAQAWVEPNAGPDNMRNDLRRKAVALFADLARFEIGIQIAEHIGEANNIGHALAVDDIQAAVRHEEFQRSVAANQRVIPPGANHSFGTFGGLVLGRRWLW